MTSELSTIWENTYGSADQYRCAPVLYLISVLSQCYSVIIDRGMSVHGHVKQVLDGVNDVIKRYICQLMSNVQLPVSNIFYSQIIIHSCTQNNDVSLFTSKKLLIVVTYTSEWKYWALY